MKKSSEIVWVYGSSAAGKETFIRHMIKNPSATLIKELGWKGKKLVPLWESIRHVAQKDKDPVLKIRKKMLGKLPKPRPNIVILIKGQDVDLVNKLPKKAQEMFPDYDHKIIFLHADFETLVWRCKNKRWWGDNYTVEDVKKWLRYQLRMLSKLKGFKVVALGSTTPKRYKRVRAPFKVKHR